LLQYTPITEALDRDVGIINKHIGNMRKYAMGNIWKISGYFIISCDFLCDFSQLCVTLTLAAGT
jgi:hypothetical protein